MKSQDLKVLAKKSDQYLEYETDELMTWCGGCGNYAIQNAVKRSLVLENIDHQNILFCFDIGCSGNESDKIQGYTIHGLHGRILPLAAGAKIANPNLTVIATAGDGATLSEGVNHLIHAIRNDYPILFLLHDNQNYALTTGQASSTSPRGCRRNAAPEGVPVDPLNPLELVLSQKPSFVAQTTSSHPDHMTDTFRKALNHKGFAFVSILQTCPTYNKQTSNQWYLENTIEVETIKKYDHTNIWDARKIVESENEKIPLGLIYQNPKKTNFLNAMENGKPRNLTKEVKHYDVSKLY